MAFCRRSLFLIIGVFFNLRIVSITGFVSPCGTTTSITRTKVEVRNPIIIISNPSSHRQRQQQQQRGGGRSSSTSSQLNIGIELKDVIFDSTSSAFDAWEWTNAIGAPAALVAGAVLVTLGETREDTAPRKTDTQRVRVLKLSMRFLLLSSFAFEVVSIFVATMTGSVLLGHGEQSVAKKLIGYGSPLQLMHHHFELEYLTTQIFFLQGLFHWLAAVAVELMLPRVGETKSMSAKLMNKCLAGWLVSLILWMLAFYNHHLSFYSDYFTMLRRFFTLFLKSYILERPIRPLSLLYVPSFLYSVRLTWKAFRSPAELDDD